MPGILVTAFRPFGQWSENSSWLALQALTRDLPPSVEVTTRLYPVDYDELRPRLAMDLSTPYDAVLHVGQASGSSAIRLERFALNTRRDLSESSDRAMPLEPTGPAAYQSALPLDDWARRLRECGAPAEVSNNAGDYLCNAAMYWSHFLIESAGRRPNVAFVHVPLEIAQAARHDPAPPSLPSELVGQALRLVVDWCVETVPTDSTLVSATDPRSGEA